MYRLIYAFEEETMYQVIFPAESMIEALKKATLYIDSEHGDGSFQKIIAISLVNKQEEEECKHE